MNNKFDKLLSALLRVCMGLIFLWAFFDKVFGLGFSTPATDAWLKGVSPTSGFLQFGTEGPLQQVFMRLAYQPFIDLLFMGGLFGIGSALLIGIGMRIAVLTGSLLMFLIWLSLFPPEHHPFLDEHIVYILVLLTLWNQKAGQKYGLGKWWEKQSLVKKYRWLE